MPALASAAITDGLISYWDFDGGATDIHGSNDGTVNGATNGIAYGKLDEGYLFDGTNDRIHIADDPSIYPSAAMTISGWFYMTNTPGGNEYLIFNGGQGSNPPNDPYEVHLTSGRVLTVLFEDNGAGAVSLTSAALTTGQWHHFVATINISADETRLYVDGSLVDSDTAGTLVALDSSGIGMLFGARQGTTAGSVFDGYFDGRMDEVGIWSRDLTQAEAEEIFNSDAGCPYDFSTCGATNVTFSASSSENASLYYDLDVTAADGSETYSYNDQIGTVTLPILTNSTKLWNFSVSADHHFPKTASSVNVTDEPTPSETLTRWAHIDAYDAYTGAQLTNFTAYIYDGLTSCAGSCNLQDFPGAYDSLSTTTGRIYVGFFGTGGVNESRDTYVNSTEDGGYFLRRYSAADYTDSGDFNASLHQAELTVFAQNRVSGASVENFTANATNATCSTTGTNCTINLSASTHTISWSKDGWYPSTLTAILSALEQSQDTFSVYDHILNVTINDVSGAGDETAFTIDIYDEHGWGFHEQLSTTSSYLEANLTAGNYTIWVNDSNWALTNTSVELNGSTNLTALEIDVYTTNSINFTFIDEITGNAVTENISVDFISSVYSLNTTTTSGHLYADLLQPAEYTIRYSSNSYPRRLAYVTVTNRTTNTRTLYMINNSASDLINLTITIVDTDVRPVQGARVKILKYFIDENDYLLVEEADTDVDGSVIVSVQEKSEFYKFVVQVDGETVTTTEPQTIKKDEIQIQVATRGETLQEYARWSSIDYTFTFNNETNNLRADWNDVTGQASQICVYAYWLRASGRELTNSSCSTAASGTMLVGILNESGREYEGILYARDPSTGDWNPIDHELVFFPDDFSMGRAGLGWQIALSFAFLAVAFLEPFWVVISVPVSLIVGRALQLNDLPYSALFGLLLVGIILVWWGRKSR